MTARARTRTATTALTTVGRVAQPMQLPNDVRLSAHAHLFFAYGADLSEALLRRRCPDVRVLGAAGLHGFGLAFAGASRTWGGATLTLVPDHARRVDGVLYLVSQVSAADLDCINGCPVVYERVSINVGEGRSANTYCMRPPLAVGAPSETYFELVRYEYERLGFDPAALIAARRRAGRASTTTLHPRPATRRLR
jgi:hypothetical protein